MLDLGNGSLGDLQQYLDPLDESSLAAVVLSHCHVDHCADVASLYVMRHYGPTPTTTPLPLLGPSDTRERIAAIYGMADPTQLDRQFDVRTLGAGPLADRPVHDRGGAGRPPGRGLLDPGHGRRAVDHLLRRHRLRPAQLVDLARGTDIALFEASFVGTDNPPNLHLTGAEAGAHRQRGRRRAAAAHPPRGLERRGRGAGRGAWPSSTGPIEQARAGMTIDLS